VVGDETRDLGAVEGKDEQVAGAAALGQGQDPRRPAAGEEVDAPRPERQVDEHVLEPPRRLRQELRQRRVRAEHRAGRVDPQPGQRELAAARRGPRAPGAVLHPPQQPPAAEACDGDPAALAGAVGDVHRDAVGGHLAQEAVKAGGSIPDPGREEARAIGSGAGREILGRGVAGEEAALEVGDQDRLQVAVEVGDFRRRRPERRQRRADPRQPEEAQEDGERHGDGAGQVGEPAERVRRRGEREQGEEQDGKPERTRRDDGGGSCGFSLCSIPRNGDDSRSGLVPPLQPCASLRRNELTVG
jgi:hypothetical protein